MQPLLRRHVVFPGNGDPAHLGNQARSLAPPVVGDGRKRVGAAGLERRPQHRRDQSQRQRRLAVVGAGLDGDATLGADGAQQLPGQAGLADAWLALDDDQPPAVAGQGGFLAQHGPLAGPADQRPVGRVLRHVVGPRRGRPLDGAALVDGVVQLAGLGQGSHAQLAVEHADALPVLAQRLRAVAAGRVQPDQ